MEALLTESAVTEKPVRKSRDYVMKPARQRPAC